MSATDVWNKSAGARLRQLATHHGLYRYDLWWWNSRGYTPAGVEVWNVIRALDYLETRPEIDASKFGITGRSGVLEGGLRRC